MAEKITTIGLGFDHVFHDRNEGWRGGAIYGEPVPGSIEGVKRILATPGKSVFTITIRENLDEIVEWFEGHGVPAVADAGEERQYWHDQDRLLVTRRLHVSALLVHNRGLKFDDWKTTLEAVNRLY
ncbi:hypothetical protein SAZ11_08610 [Streptomyces sp. FXJ1.4098]|nr:hypothetical protein [Streptomyces sp. FXJ1.4098]